MFDYLYNNESWNPRVRVRKTAEGYKFWDIKWNDDVTSEIGKLVAMWNKSGPYYNCVGDKDGPAVVAITDVDPRIWDVYTQDAGTTIAKINPGPAAEAKAILKAARIAADCLMDIACPVARDEWESWVVDINNIPVALEEML